MELDSILKLPLFQDKGPLATFLTVVMFAFYALERVRTWRKERRSGQQEEDAGKVSGFRAVNEENARLMAVVKEDNARLRLETDALRVRNEELWGKLRTAEESLGKASRDLAEALETIAELKAGLGV